MSKKKRQSFHSSVVCLSTSTGFRLTGYGGARLQVICLQRDKNYAQHLKLQILKGCVRREGHAIDTEFHILKVRCKIDINLTADTHVETHWGTHTSQRERNSSNQFHLLFWDKHTRFKKICTLTVMIQNLSDWQYKIMYMRFTDPWRSCCAKGNSAPNSRNFYRKSNSQCNKTWKTTPVLRVSAPF